MNAVESPPSAPAVPPWLSPHLAADVLQRASSVLGGQPWPDEGDLRWSGWGGPSAELISSMPGRWVQASSGSPDAPQTVGIDPTSAAGLHAMVDRLTVDRSERLDWLAGLWRQVMADGLFALTHPVHVRPTTPDARPAGTDGNVVDHQGLVEDLLAATCGRVLTTDLVVHHPPPITGGVTWVTFVLRRLG